MEILELSPESLAQALDPVRVQFAPLPQYLEATRKWQGIPGIERTPQGRLWATWYSGGCHEGPLNYIVLVSSDDDGTSWSDPCLVIDPPGIIRASDPVLWHDPLGRLWLFWMQSAMIGQSTFDGRGGVWFIRSDDANSANPVWTAPQRLANGIMMNKPTVLSSDQWLFPCAVWSYRSPYYHSFPAEQFSNVFVSRDQGKNFKFLGCADVPNRSCDEHMIVERKDGTLWMLVRRTDGVGQAISTDQGKTWTVSAEPVLPGPCARFHIRRLQSGHLLLINHHEFTGRSRLTAFLSDDDGTTWPHHLLIDERTDVSYPDAIQAPDGQIHLIYDRNRIGESEILYQSFSEEDILAARNPGHASGRLRVISKLPRVDLGQNKTAFEEPNLIDHLINVSRKTRDDSRTAIHADSNDGELLLLPFRFDGNSLQIEFSTADKGSIRVELRTFLDVPIKGYTLDDCVELRDHDQTSRVCWSGDTGLDSLAGQLIRMRIEIKNADLFSLRFLNYD